MTASGTRTTRREPVNGQFIDPRDEAVRGHPRGLAVLASTELAERFSYYGMTALLALYLSKQLMPDHSSQVLGLSALRRLFEFRAPLPDAAFASLIYGWYGGLVYFTPILGGWIADRWLGMRRTVILGALLMAAGHLAMTFDRTFLIALLLLILGSGCLKGNISAQVGTLYTREEESRRARGFTIFSSAINAGSVLGPLATGAAAEACGWHAGFALAAIVMLVALAVYLCGQGRLPEPRTARKERIARPPLSSVERRRTLALIALVGLTVPANIAYPMIWNIGVVWVDQRVWLQSPLGAVPAAWFNSVDAFASILATPVLVALWGWQACRDREPTSICKIGIGSALVGASALLFVLGELTAGADGHVSVLWALAGYTGMGFAFMWYWPVLLALVSELAPATINSTMVSAAFLSFFAGSVAMGWVGSFFGQMSDWAFWTLDASIGLVGGFLIFVCRPWLVRALD